MHLKNRKSILVFVFVIFSSHLISIEAQDDYNYSPVFQKRIKRQLSNLDSLIKNDCKPQQIAQTNFNIAWSHLNISGEFNKAEEYLNAGNEIIKNQALKDTSLITSAHTLAGRILTKQGLFVSAIDQYQKAYELGEEQRDTAFLGYLLQVMAKTLREQKKYKESIPLLLKSLDYKKIVKKEKPLIVYGMLASSYFGIGELVEAKIYLDLAQSIAKEKSKKRQYYGLYILRSEIALDEEKQDSAFIYASIAYDGLMLSGGAKGEIIDSELSLAKAYFALGNYKSASSFAETAYRKAQKYNFSWFEIEALRLKTDLAMLRGNYKLALESNKLYFTKRQDLFKEEEIKQNLDFQNRWNLKEKEQEISLLNLQFKDQVAAIAQEKKTSGMLSGLLILTAVILGLSILFFYYSTKLKNRLRDSAKAIRNQKETKIRLESIIQGQEIERLRIARELHDGLGGILSTGALKANIAGVDEVSEILSTSCDELRRITSNLSPLSLESLGLETALTDLVIRASNNKTKVISEVAIKTEIDKKTEINIFRIVQELINNGLKHSQAGDILVQVLQNEDIQIIYEDDGIGFKLEITPEGQGLKNIRSRTEMLNGIIHIDSELNKGTFINISIPQKSAL